MSSSKLFLSQQIYISIVPIRNFEQFFALLTQSHFHIIDLLVLRNIQFQHIIFKERGNSIESSSAIFQNSRSMTFFIVKHSHEKMYGHDFVPASRTRFFLREINYPPRRFAKGLPELHRASIPATAAPKRVARKLTASLFIPFRPRTGGPFRRSVSLPVSGSRHWA